MSDDGDDRTFDGPLDLDLDDDDERERAAEVARRMAEVQRQLAAVPAAQVVANHVMGLYELAAIHLSSTPPRFDQASVAIDAMAGIVDKLPGRLGPEEATLRDALAQIRLAFVTLRDRDGDADA